jgi:hypothetical protein
MYAPHNMNKRIRKKRKEKKQEHTENKGRYPHFYIITLGLWQKYTSYHPKNIFLVPCNYY